MSKIWIGTTQELEKNPMKRFDVNGNDILVIRLHGKYYALSNTCTHENFPLSHGELDETQIVCAKHGARYDVRDGSVKALPAVRPLQKYTILVEGEDMFIELPNHA